jgi:uncharacterized membrane protein
MADHPDSRLISFRNSFFTGLLLLAPLVVTLWTLRGIIELFGGTFRPLFLYYLPAWLQQRPALNLVWDIIATVIVVLLITGLGYLSRYFFGKYLWSITERAVQSIPGVNAFYNTVKQIVETFSTQKRDLFSKVVMVEFPRKGSWAIGFLTSQARGEAQSKTGADVLTIFIPTAPNPTSGFLLLIPRPEVVELEMSVGEGMKMIISGGAVIPPWPATKPPVLPP